MVLFFKKKILHLTLFSLISACYSCSVAAPVSLAEAGCQVKWDTSVFSPKPDVNGRVAPDYGVYWLKSDQNSQESARRAYMPIWSSGTANSLSRENYNKQLAADGYFDPSKPTIIFIHGWQPGRTEMKSRIDLCYRYPKDSQDHYTSYYELREHWKDWNVGIFYWNQFADESGNPVKKFQARFAEAILDTQSKIYTPPVGHERRRGMRWAYMAANKLLHCNRHLGSRCIMPPIEQSVGHVEDVGYMAYRAFANAFPQGYAARQLPVRVLGQSLGAQVAIQVVYHAVTHDIDPTKKAIEPTRLSLFDPYFSNQGVDGMKETVADKNIEEMNAVLKYHPDFPIAIYRATDMSTPMFHGDPVESLVQKAAFFKLNINYLENMKPKGVFNKAYLKKYFSYLMLQHASTVFVYFRAKDRVEGVGGCLNANLSNADLLKLRGTKHECDINVF